MTHQLVETAIDRSKATNSIVHITRTEMLQARVSSEFISTELLVECESNVEANGVEEFWGQDCEGVEWRVHVAMSVGDENS